MTQSSTLTTRQGLAQALGAALLWGAMPLYFHALDSVDPMELVAHRILWSAPLLVAILWWRGDLTKMRQALAVPRTRLLLAFSSLFIAGNWLIYVIAVQQGQVLAASLGYFINPLLSVLLGVIVLRERVTPVQWMAIAVAGAGVAVLAAGALSTLWISLALAGLWGLYSLARRVAVVEAMPGLALETLALLPFAIGLILWRINAGTAHDFGVAPTLDALLLGVGALTALPLLLFNLAVKKLSFATIGLVQYVAPSIQFLLAVFLFGEPLTMAHIIAFPLIWTGLAIYSISTLRAYARTSGQLAANPAE
jgi:chloramphenicol-sensitive protein RarD